MKGEREVNGREASDAGTLLPSSILPFLRGFAPEREERGRMGRDEGILVSRPSLTSLCTLLTLFRLLALA